MQKLTKMFQDFVVDYGRIRLKVKRANIKRLQFLLQTTSTGTSENPKRLRRELDAALASEKATVVALKKAGVKNP